MLKFRVKTYIAITAIILAVILIGVGIFIFLKNKTVVPSPDPNVTVEIIEDRHPLNGQPIADGNFSFFPIAIMIDNAYNIRPQYGLSQADIIYEALAESNITRLLAIFDSRQSLEKIGPVRSARPYFMDWAEEYSGIYMHVGGSPQALAAISQYDFTNIDQIGIGETYFWRDKNKSAPSNVLTSSANWLRVGEIKSVQKFDTVLAKKIAWNFIEPTASTTPPDFSVNFSADIYKVDWQYNDKLGAYERSQGGDKFVFDTGEQAFANNIIVQIVKSSLLDVERRQMETKTTGPVFIFNQWGQQSGQWKYQDGRTKFFADDGSELKLVPGKTWVEVIDSEDKLVTK